MHPASRRSASGSSSRRSFASFAAVASIAGLLLSACASAPDAPQPTDRMALHTHASFFSQETKQAAALDPQVFVQQPDAPAATGPQGIAHREGLRNALVADDPSLPLFNADGAPLGVTLGAWLNAYGIVTITPAGGGRQRIDVDATGLVPNGTYSVFENHFDQQPVGFTPLDGSGTGNTFKADATGHGTISVIAPAPLTNANAVLLVYQADGQAHGMMRGRIGVDAFHQAIVRVP